MKIRLFFINKRKVFISRTPQLTAQRFCAGKEAKALKIVFAEFKYPPIIVIFEG